MKILTVMGAAILMSGCAVKLVDSRLDIEKLQTVLEQHSMAINNITDYVAELQAKGKLPKPENKVHK